MNDGLQGGNREQSRVRTRQLLAGVLLLLGLGGVALAASTGAPLGLQNGTDIYYLRDHAQMLEDRSGTLTVDEVAHGRTFQPFGAMRDANAHYWIRFTVSAQQASTNRWYLFMGYKPRFVDFYAPQPDGTYAVQHSGNAMPYRDRPVKVYGWIAFALPVATKPQTYYARIQTVEPTLTVAIDSSEFFFRQNQQQLLMIVGLTSVLVALALSSMILFGLARGRVYLYYALYLIAQLFYRANDVGVAAAYLWPGSSMSWTQLDVFFDGLTVVAATLFVRAFLHTAHLSRVLDRINIGIAVVAGLYAIAGILNVPFKISWAWNFGYIYVPVWIVSGILAWRAGEEQAKFFLLAWIALMAGILASDIKQLGVGSGNFFAEFVLSHGPYFGIAIQSTFLSLALAIELRQLTSAKARFESLAVTDTVTDIANRRVFDERLRSEWNRALRNGKPLAVLIADVDFFKPFNDQYGHAAGDHCLRAIAKSGAGCMNRPGDTFCRFGGEEFAAVLPETDREGALAIAECIRTAILELNIGHERSSAGVVTISVGVASSVPTSQNSAAGVVNAADNALYRAKANGRNRVVTENYESVGNVLSMV